MVAAVAVLRPPSPAAVAFLLALPVLAGCLGAGNDAGGDDAPGEAPSALPRQCDAERAAVAHGPGGVPREAAFPLHPCLSKTGFNSREPTMGISATGAIFHYPAMTGDNVRPTGVAVSRDRGASWSLSLPVLAGAPTHPSSLDPYFYLDASTGRMFADDLATVSCSWFSWSDDEGATWDHSLSGCMETDHQTIFAGPPATSTTTGYPNVVYRCAINAVALGGASTMSTCQRSLDGGRLWQPPGAPAFTSEAQRLPDVCSGAHGHGVVDASGTLYLPKGHCGVPMLAISDDEGASWRRVTVSDKGIQGHEAGVGVDADGRIYYTWSADDGLPYLAHSADGGATWSEPLMLAPPGLVDAVFPELYVGGRGKLAVAYVGSFQGSSDPERSYEALLTVTWDALADEPTFYTGTVNDPEADAFILGECCGGLQDFLDVVIGPDGVPWGAYIDDCIGPGRSCSARTEVLDTQRVGAVGWLVGGPSLWDEDDPNGPYP